MEAVVLGLVVVFLAEIGDKTQLVAASLATRFRPWPVFAGVVLAQMLSQALAVVVGGLLGSALPTAPLGIVAGLAFLGFAAWTFRADDDDGEADETLRIGGRSVVVSVALAMFVAELGDKTMLATAALATQADPVWTWVGATLGVVAAGGVAVLAGNALGQRLSGRVVRLVSAGAFAVFGIAMLVVSISDLAA